MKLSAQSFKNNKAFTLIELIVVIAIIGVLAASLLVVIDPLDKINSANDVAVVSSLAQFGRSNDNYAATHSNVYVGGATVGAALTDLLAAGESKFGAYTPPTGYTVNYAATTSGGAACTTAAQNCGLYAFWVSALKSKKNTGGTPPAGGPIYVYANGLGCYKAAGTVITAATTCP